MFGEVGTQVLVSKTGEGRWKTLDKGRGGADKGGQGRLWKRINKKKQIRNGESGGDRGKRWTTALEEKTKKKSERILKRF